MSSGNDTKSFEGMFRKYQPMLVRYAATMLYDEEEARGVVQEVFIKIWQKRDSLTFGDELKSYLFRAVRNQALNKISRNKMDTVSLDEQTVLVAEEEKVGEQDKQENLRRIQQQIKALPGNCREIFMMSRMEGLTHAEIAEILDISTKTVENQIGIALKKIRKGVFQKS